MLNQQQNKDEYTEIDRYMGYLFRILLGEIAAGDKFINAWRNNPPTIDTQIHIAEFIFAEVDDFSRLFAAITVCNKSSFLQLLINCKEQLSLQEQNADNTVEGGIAENIKNNLVFIKNLLLIRRAIETNDLTTADQILRSRFNPATERSLLPYIASLGAEILFITLMQQHRSLQLPELLQYLQPILQYQFLHTEILYAKIKMAYNDKMNNAQIRDCVTCFSKILVSYPYFGDIFYQRALGYSSLEEPHKAFADLLQALQFEPNNEVYSNIYREFALKSAQADAEKLFLESTSIKNLISWVFSHVASNFLLKNEAVPFTIHLLISRFITAAKVKYPENSADYKIALQLQDIIDYLSLPDPFNFFSDPLIFSPEHPTLLQVDLTLLDSINENQVEENIFECSRLIDDSNSEDARPKRHKYYLQLALNIAKIECNRNPNSPQHYINIGLIHLALLNYDQAKTFFTKSLGFANAESEEHKFILKLMVIVNALQDPEIKLYKKMLEPPSKSYKTHTQLEGGSNSNSTITTSLTTTTTTTTSLTTSTTPSFSAGVLPYGNFFGSATESTPAAESSVEPPKKKQKTGHPNDSTSTQNKPRENDDNEPSTQKMASAMF